MKQKVVIIGHGYTSRLEQNRETAIVGLSICWMGKNTVKKLHHHIMDTRLQDKYFLLTLSQRSVCWKEKTLD